MAYSGPISPAGGADRSDVGTVAWDPPEYILSSNDEYASASSESKETTHYLQAYGFGFTIPTDAVIRGIQVDIERHGAGPNYPKDNSIKLVKTDDVIVGDDKADTVTDWTSDLDTYYPYGGEYDLWGYSWTPALINDGTTEMFGVVLAVDLSGDTGDPCTAYVDHMRITVYYSEVKDINGLLRSSTRFVNDLGTPDVATINGLV